MTKSVYLGAMDWLWPGWTGAFYPADMPEEWRLAYYSSQFNCVWMGAARWQGVSVPEWIQWRDDVHSRFLFLLEDGGAGVALPVELAGKALLVPPGDDRVRLFDRHTDLAVLAGEIQDRDEDLYLLSRDGDLGQLERVRTLLELLGR